jgi:hypothetical protein
MTKSIKRSSIKHRKITRKNKGGSIKKINLLGDIQDEMTDKYRSIKNRTKIAVSKRLGKLWTSKKLEKEKENFKHIDPRNMEKNKTYFIEHEDKCSFESGTFEDTFEEGIHTGAIFQNLKLLYKSSKPDCIDFPASYTKPIYGEDGDTVIGRTGEIRLNNQYKFYEEKK